ncbi:Fe(2+) transporter [Clydaea vesicula]|uniref:Fe(2+) transporter n=1 Tax=Clydaea vesicula TaxID=447962 RepID=A0AAD5TX92_9FUNG|nr:Fe(2+) transporter [Clydaea vesicula]
MQMQTEESSLQKVIQDIDVEYESLESSSLLTNAMAGALAGITEHTVMYPIDSIKTRMQVVKPNPQAIYSGILNAISKISSTEGVATLWRGPAHALYFGMYEHCKVLFGAEGEKQNFLAIAAAGSCATIAADGFMNPFDVIKQRMQLHGNKFRSVAKCGLSVLKNEGISAFYVSLPTTLMMTIPFQAIHFSTYEFLRKNLNPSNTYDPKTHVISGGLAGAVAAAITNPLDVTKTLLQTKGSIKSDASLKNINGMFQGVKFIYEKNGWKGFTLGIRPRVLSHIPSTAICWTTVSNFSFLMFV